MTEAANLTFASRRADDFRLMTAVSAAHFVSHYYILVLPPVFAFVRAEYGVSYTELALALAVFNIVSAVLQTPAGFLVDRFNARLILGAGLLIGAAGLMIAATVHSYWVLVAMFGVMGVGNTVYHPADYALLSRHVSPARISQAYSVHTFAGLLGSAAAPAGMLFMHSLFGWRGALISAALLGIVVALPLLLQRDSAIDQAAAKPRSNAPADTGWRLLLSTPILINFLFFTLIAFGNYGLMNFAVVALGALHGTPAATANTALSANLFMAAIGVLIGGLIASRFSRHGLVVTLGLLAAGLSTLLISASDLGAALLILIMSFTGMCFGIVMPSRDMIVRSVTPPGAFGKVFGFVTNGFNIGGILSPLLFGALMDHGAPRLVFWVIAASTVACVATVASLPRRRAA
jgi:FSR family fosmidomycin resistance protein-like MFS transporter